MDAFVVDAAVEIVDGGDVKPPEILRLPGSHGVRVDGADVGVSQQAEHLEAFRRADRQRQLFQRGRVEDVAAHRDRHLQVGSNQENRRYRARPAKEPSRRRCE